MPRHSSGEDGYRRLTMEDELAILQEEFDEFVESRFGKKYQEWNIKQINAINDIQKTKQRLGIGDGKVYEPEKYQSGLPKISSRREGHI